MKNLRDVWGRLGRSATDAPAQSEQPPPTTLHATKAIAKFEPGALDRLINGLPRNHLNLLRWLDEIGRPVSATSTRMVLTRDRRAALRQLADAGLVLVLNRGSASVRNRRQRPTDLVLVNHAAVGDALDRLGRG